MRLLFIGFNSRYINPTNSLLPSMLRLAADTVYYGPGFSDSRTLAGGIRAFIDERGPFDAVATTTQLCAGGDAAATAAFLQRYAVSPWSSADAGPFVSDVTAFLEQAGPRRICFVTDLDVYAVDGRMADSLRTRSDYFVGWGQGFTQDVASLEHLRREQFYEAKAATRPIGLWHDFVADQRAAFINFGHFVGTEEFSWTPLQGRPYTAYVPGQLYARRRDAVQALAASGGVTMPRQAYRKFFALLDRLGLKPYSNPYLHALYGLIFATRIRRSRFVFTEGSGYQRPLRKFFEIPALGSLLMCAPCAGFGDLGFADGKNAVVVDDRTLPERIAALLERPDQAQAIADGGRRLVWERHSLPARAAQFRQCLDAIVEGEFAGSRWQGGNFLVERQDKG